MAIPGGRDPEKPYEILEEVKHLLSGLAQSEDEPPAEQSLREITARVRRELSEIQGGEWRYALVYKHLRDDGDALYTATIPCPACRKHPVILVFSVSADGTFDFCLPVDE
jgi:hypothetical protein